MYFREPAIETGSVKDTLAFRLSSTLICKARVCGALVFSLDKGRMLSCSGRRRPGPFLESHNTQVFV